MPLNERIATEALALVGTPFRLHGRSTQTGLDCVGLAVLAAERAGAAIGQLPAYALRGMSAARAREALARAGCARAPSAEPGDIIVAESGPMQLHLMILTAQGLVHAHAGLGRVVLMPRPSPWPVIGQWRLLPATEKA